MSDAASEPGAREEVERLAQEFVERRRRGEQPLIEDYAAAHPALAGEIRALFPTLLLVEEFGSPIEESAIVQAVTPDESAPQDVQLQQVGEYRLLREIGRGGMGIVYEAEQASLGRRVALKVLPFHSLLDSKRLERFRQEARAAARLSHPNIVPVYGVGEHLGMHYYVMQLIPGQGLHRVIEEVRRAREAGEPESVPRTDGDDGSSSSLAAGLESGGPRGGRERYFRNVARLARDTALALDYAHGEGILHRDVKPSNLLLDPTGRVWLTDFGLAKAEGSDELTHSGDFVGTLLYMAPERFKGWSDPRSDVYALGITLHELLTLRPAFAERDRAQLLRKVASEGPAAPRRIDRTIPRDLETIVLKAVAREPTQRYGSARAMAEDLDRFFEGRPVEARRSNALARLGRWCARNPLPAALVAAIVILLVVVAAISSTAAVRLAGEQAAGREKLRAAYLAEASALRASTHLGRRYEALQALQQAAAIHPGADLVNEALACFAQADLRLLKTWPRRQDEVYCLSADGATVAVALPGGEIVLRDANDDRELLRLPDPGFRAAYTWIRLSPNGKQLAARYELGRRVEWVIWALDRRLPCATLKEASPANSLDFSPDGRWAVAAPRDRGLRLLDLTTGSTLGELARDLPVRNTAIHPGGRLIAFSSQQTRQVHILDRESGHTVRSLSGSSLQPFAELAWHPDGRMLAAAHPDHLIYLWNAESGERLRTLQGHWAEAWVVKLDPTGTILASTGWDPAVRFWDPGTGRQLFALPDREGYFDFSGSGRCWSIMADRVEEWELASTAAAFSLHGHAYLGPPNIVAKHPLAISLAPGGRLAATSGEDGVRLWDLASRIELAHLPVGKTEGVQFAADGSSLYAGSLTGLVRWPLRAAGEAETRLAIGPLQRLSRLEGWGRLALSRDGTRVAAVHLIDHAHILEPSRPERDLKLTGLRQNWTITLSSDGVWAAAGTWGKEHADGVLVWDLREQPGDAPVAPARTLQPARKIPAPRAEVQFHPDAAHLATSTPGEHTLWRLADGAPVWSIERERGQKFPGYLTFDRGGKVGAAAYNASRLWLIEALSGRKLAELEAPEPLKLTGLALEDGTLAASTLGRRFHVWDLKGLGRELAALGLSWELPSAGQALAGRPALHVSVIEETLDVLFEECRDLAAQQLFRPLEEAAFLPRLATCAQIDRALSAPQIVIPDGAAWKLLRGRSEPSAGEQWIGLDFDDRAWESGASPFTSWGDEAAARGTHLGDQLGSFTTLYLRHAFQVSDPASISPWLLAVEVEDGFVAYLNGEEIGRLHAGSREEKLTFRSLAQRRDQHRMVGVCEIPPALLRAGKNVLAIQALTYAADSYIYVLPVLAGASSPDVELDRSRTQQLLTDADGKADALLLAYRDGRLLQRSGRHQEALVELERASRLDPGAAEPLLRQLACHRALGDLPRAEGLVREAIEAGRILEDARLWRAWHHVVLVDARRPLAEAIASLPRDPRHNAFGPGSDHRWILEQLAAGKTVRLHCGGGELGDGEVDSWSRDRFYLGGVPLEKGAAAGRHADTDAGTTKAALAELGITERAFAGKQDLHHAYSIPLPPGRYRAKLHFVEWKHNEPGRRVFDVLIEGRTVLESCNPMRAGSAGPASRAFDVDITDGALDLDLLAIHDHPRIAGIEVKAIDK